VTLKSVLEQNIDPEWLGETAYMVTERKEYILTQPHCEHATPFRDTSGAIMWRCEHPGNTVEVVRDE
jgi:hypothetical protein